jgi:uncharacterized protein (TIGR02452 family)
MYCFCNLLCKRLNQHIASSKLLVFFKCLVSIITRQQKKERKEKKQQMENPSRMSNPQSHTIVNIQPFSSQVKSNCQPYFQSSIQPTQSNLQMHPNISTSPFTLVQLQSPIPSQSQLPSLVQSSTPISYTRLHPITDYQRSSLNQPNQLTNSCYQSSLPSLSPLPLPLPLPSAPLTIQSSVENSQLQQNQLDTSQSTSEQKLGKPELAEIAKQNQNVAKAYHGSCTISIHVPTLLSTVDPQIEKPFRSKVNFVESTTEEAIMDAFQKNRYSSIVVLNFADRKLPGGYYLQGAKTQEEALCRAMPALYPSLAHSGCYPYDYQTTILWTPKSYFARNPKTKNFDFLSEPIPVSVVSMAAPEIPGGETFDLNNMKSMLQGVFVAPYVLKKCNTIIVGAIGCGAFRNDPTAIAKAFSSPLKIWTSLSTHYLCDPRKG